MTPCVHVRGESNASQRAEVWLVQPDEFQQRLFRACSVSRARAHLIAEKAGVVSGLEELACEFAEAAVQVELASRNGAGCESGSVLASFSGAPAAIVEAENSAIGIVSKPSGVATAAARAVKLARGRIEIICGGWKKLPPAFKTALRRAVQDGGAKPRITDPPFLYLDKNYLRIFGGINAALDKVAALGHLTVVQVRGEFNGIAAEAVQAARGGAAILMIDTGRREHLQAVGVALRDAGLRQSVRLAFAGNIAIEAIPELCEEDVDLLDIGYAVLDAPALPMRFDVIETER